MKAKLPRVDSDTTRASEHEKADQTDAFVPPLTISHRRILSKGRDDEFRQTIYLIVQVLRRLEACRTAFGRALGLTGTPAYVVGNRILSGAVGYDEMKKAIAEARAAK